MCNVVEQFGVVNEILWSGDDQTLGGFQTLLCLAGKNRIPDEEDQKHNQHNAQCNGDDKGVTEPEAGTEGGEHEMNCGVGELAPGCSAASCRAPKLEGFPISAQLIAQSGQEIIESIDLALHQHRPGLVKIVVG